MTPKEPTEQEEWCPDNIWDTHEKYHIEDWRVAVAYDATRLGYIAWVNHKLTL